jgi:hypothetical protein
MNFGLRRIALQFVLTAGLYVMLVGSVFAFSYSEFPLTAADPIENAEFGRSIAVDGDCVVVGAAEGSDEVAVGTGAAYVFRYFGGAYVQEAKLDPKFDDPDIEDGAEFGRAVAVKGNVIVVGARFAKSGSTEKAGAAYIYKKTNGAWSFVQKVAAGDSAPEDNFGRAVALDNDLLVVTARKEDVSVENDGAAYVFRQRRGIWVQEAKLTASDSTTQARFGQSVAVRGNLVVVGARDANTPVTDGAGAVYLFSHSQGRWNEFAKLYAGDGAGGDQFAFNVAVSGNLIAVGARRADPVGKKDAGAVYLFQVLGKSWHEVGKLTANDAKAGDELGHSVAMSGDFIAAGARRTDIDGKKDQGAVYLFKRSGNHWVEEAKIIASDGGAGDEFGHSLSAHGNKIAVGANIADVEVVDQGAAYVYHLGE